ncbi:MAG: peptide ABC transporter [Variovorax paradoxus]|nr:MAG: peptide ABC transporter [Variovorax paradoxus]PZQ00157.1 MAG: peptide ABC transporter [Variovorax paradoxus]
MTARLILSRLLSSIPTLLIVAVIVFLMLRLSPVDPAAIMAGDLATPEMVAAIRADLGMDQPMHVQFWNWMVQLGQGDFGQSILSRQPVRELIWQRAEPTIALATTTLLLAVLVAIPLGVIAAWRHGGWLDRGVMLFSVLGFSVPVFVVSYVYIYVAAIQLQWLPVQGFAPLADGLGPFVRQLTLPTLALAFPYVALFARITRASLLNVLGEDYIRTAHAKGVAERTVLIKHGLRNAAVPIVSVIGTGFAALVGGVAVTESVFNIPGVGRLIVDAVLARDYPIIQGVIIVLAAMYVVVNLLIDIAYVLLDPRIRY